IDNDNLMTRNNMMHTDLKRMQYNKFISEKKYYEAIDYDITEDFTTHKSIQLDRYPAVVNEAEKQAKEILKEHLANEDGYILDDLEDDETLDEQYDILADRSLRLNGYKIHTTINKKMYDKMEKIVKSYEHFGPDRTFTKEVDGESKQVTEPVESAVVLIENKTGKLLSFSPGRNHSMDKPFNL